MTPNEVLKKYYGYDQFRPGQIDMIQAILEGRDVLGIMPTGAGKSVCYQVPALIMPGITLVVSPLISLMTDQVRALNEAGVHAAYINSSLTENQISLALRYAAEGRYKIIYVAPERLESSQFLYFVNQVEISMVAVDEAHCISQWGQDFRPSYVKIKNFIKLFAVRPVVAAFTATATTRVKDDIARILDLKEPQVLITGFDRPNLYFAVGRVADKMQYLKEYIEDHGDVSGIIYCSTRKNVDQVCETLQAWGVKAGKYHAGMEPEERSKSQEDFIYDRTQVIVATNAFGMGIDKSNVRYVIHYNMPQSMENYYQEAGRAGRDGEESEAILLYSAQDSIIARFLIDKKEFPEEMTPEEILHVRDADKRRLKAMERYCKTTRCLRNEILKYFGEHPKEECGKCATCRREFIVVRNPRWDTSEAEERAEKQLAREARGGSRRGSSYGDGGYGGTSYGGRYSAGSYSGSGGRDFHEEAGWDDLMADSRSAFGGGSSHRYRSEYEDNSWMSDRNGFGFSKEQQTRRKRSGLMDGRQQLLFAKLRELRLTVSKEEGVPPYQIFSDKTLNAMCKQLPETKEEMLQVEGVTEIRYEKYGWRFLAMLRG